MYVYILGIFFLIFRKNCFYHFHFFFWWSIKFPQENINQSEIEIGDKYLSVELLSIYFKKLITPNTHYLLCESPTYLRREYFQNIEFDVLFALNLVLLFLNQINVYLFSPHVSISYHNYVISKRHNHYLLKTTYA